jgi:hypothetical protein
MPTNSGIHFSATIALASSRERRQQPGPVYEIEKHLVD